MSNRGDGRTMETLFTDEKWTIESDTEFPDNFDYVSHKCPWKKNWLLKSKPMSVYTMDKLQTCQHCGTDIPDSIVGLWKLKNFDKLQAKHQAEEAHKAQWKNFTPGFYATAKWVGRPGQTYEFYPS